MDTITLAPRGVYQLDDELVVAHPTDDGDGHILCTPREWRLGEAADLEADADGRLTFQGRPTGGTVADLVDTRFREPTALDDAGVTYARHDGGGAAPDSLLVLDFGPYALGGGGGQAAAEVRNEHGALLVVQEPLARREDPGWDEGAWRAAVRAVVADLAPVLDGAERWLVWDPERDGTTEEAV